MFSVHLYQYMLIYQRYLEKQNKAIIGGGVAMEGMGNGNRGRKDGNGRDGEWQWERGGMAMGGRMGNGFD